MIFLYNCFSNNAIQRFANGSAQSETTWSQRGYTEWRDKFSNKKLTIDIMADIEMRAIKEAGIPEDIATGWVVKALAYLKAQGAPSITNIPWNKLN